MSTEPSIFNSPPLIDEFYIIGLHGEKNVNIKFNSNIKILVSDNGAGKTTILNILYLIISNQTDKLSKYNFKEVGLFYTENNKKCSIKINLRKPLKSSRSDLEIIKEISKRIPLNVLRRERNEAFHYGGELAISRYLQYIEKLSRETKIDQNLIIKALGKDNDFDFYTMRENIPARIKRKILQQFEITKTPNDSSDFIFFDTLYLPTFRRIEADLKDLLETDTDNRTIFKSLRDRSFFFGMEDVIEALNNITQDIRSSSVVEFNKINGQMLTKLTEKDSAITEEMVRSVQDIEAVKVILARVGKNLEEDQKRKIIQLIENNEIRRTNNLLVFFLNNLLEAYKQQKEKDESIKKFIQICNQYFTSKQVIYNESKVDITIQMIKTQKDISLDLLSSGEKQMISLFTQIYLNNTKPLAIFFDEPELSLSIEWQEKLLPDILASNNCKFLFVTTHSPFIFSNDLKSHAIDLNSCITDYTEGEQNIDLGESNE